MNSDDNLGGECSLVHEDVKLTFDDYEFESLGWLSSIGYELG